MERSSSCGVEILTGFTEEQVYSIIGQMRMRYFFIKVPETPPRSNLVEQPMRGSREMKELFRYDSPSLVSQYMFRGIRV